MAIENYIGQGIVFPIELNSVGKPDVETGFKLVNSSIKNILLWPINQRIFLSEYGSIIDLLLEEPNDFLLTKLVQNFIYNSLNQWEKRIEIINTEVLSVSVEKLEISITYKLSKSNLEDTLTFPFYRNIIY